MHWDTPDEPLIEVNDVPLYATEEHAIIYESPQGRVEWGEWADNAATYRAFVEMHADIDRLATMGVYFELLWAVSRHWLWKHTNDMTLNVGDLDEVAELRYTNDYDFSSNKKREIARVIWDFLESTPAVQDTLIKKRQEQKTDSALTGSIHRLRVGKYEGDYVVHDVLFTDENRKQFHEFVEEHDWEVDPDEYIDETFEEADNYGGPDTAVVSTDATPKPMRRFADALVSLAPEYSQDLAKVVTVAPYRDDIELDVTPDYESGDLHFTLTATNSDD